MCKYYAFISYSSKDKKWGQWLINELETYVIPDEIRREYPDLPDRLCPIFRDRDELAASTSLSKAIQEGLEQSRTLIVVCSNNAVNSIWVNKEISFFRSLVGRKIFAFIISGVPNADNENECFPRELKNLFLEEEILAPDINEDGTQRALIKLIAGLLGIEFDELYRRDARRRKQQNYFACIREVNKYLFSRAYDKAEETLLLLTEEEEEFDFRHWEWYHLMLCCNLDIMTLIHHAQGISCASFSQNYKYVLAGSYDGTVTIWSLDTGEIKFSIKAHSKKINEVDFGLNDEIFLTASTDRTVKLWNTSGSLLQTFSKKPEVPDLLRYDEVFWDFSLGNKVVSSAKIDIKNNHVIATTGVTVTVWDITSGELVKVLRGEKTDDFMESVTLSEDFNWIVATSDRNIYMWQNHSKNALRSFSSNNFVIGVIGTKALLNGENNTIHIWDLVKDKDCREPKIVPLRNEILDMGRVAFSGDDNYLIVADEHDVQFWNLTSSENYIHHPCYVLSDNDGEITSVAYSPTKKLLLTASMGKLKLWNKDLSVASRIIDITKAGSSNYDHTIISATSSTDERLIIAGSSSGKIFSLKFDGFGFTQYLLYEKKRLTELFFKFSTCQNFVIIASDTDPWVDVWSIKEEKIVNQLYIHNERVNMMPNLPANFKQILSSQGGSCCCIEVDHDGKIFVGCIDGTIRVFNLHQDIERKCLSIHQDKIVFLLRCHHENDGFLITSSSDRTIKLWSIHQDDLILERSWNIDSYRICCGVLVADGGTLLCGCFDGTMLALDIFENGELLKINAHTKAVLGLLVSPDFKRIVTGCEDGTIKIFCADTFTELLTLTNHYGSKSIPIGYFSNMEYLLTINSNKLVLWGGMYGEIKSKQDIALWKKHKYSAY